MKGKDLRIVFMGTPDFAVASLKALTENGYQIAGVITAPDKPAGRGQKLNESAVKQYAVAKGLKILQPEKLKAPVFIEELKSLQADLQVVVAFRMLPEVVWNMPRLGTFNLHASLLPQYRGAAPLNWAIINGEKETGVTTFLLDHEIDTGKILMRDKVEIKDNENVGQLHHELMDIGARLVLETVDLLAEGKGDGIPQTEFTENMEDIKHAPKIFKEDCKINWKNDIISVYNLIRGLSPYPAAWAEMQHQVNGRIVSMKIFAAEKTENNTEKYPPGHILSDEKNELKVACKNGWIRITELQVSGKKRMPADNFLRGFQQISEYRFI